MAEVKTYTVAMLAVLVLALGGFDAYDYLTTPSYKQCRSGNTYGTWESTNDALIYACDLTQEKYLCWKTTKTRCYLFDEEAVKQLDVEGIIDPDKQPIYGNAGVEQWDCPKRPEQCIPG